jgi:midasin
MDEKVDMSAQRRVVGDTSQEVRNRSQEIRNATDVPPVEGKPDGQDHEMEYVEEEREEPMQALGPAQDDEAAKLRDLKLVDDQVQSLLGI